MSSRVPFGDQSYDCRSFVWCRWPMPRGLSQSYKPKFAGWSVDSPGPPPQTRQRKEELFVCPRKLFSWVSPPNPTRGHNRPRQLCSPTLRSPVDGRQPPRLLGARSPLFVPVATALPRRALTQTSGREPAPAIMTQGTVSLPNLHLLPPPSLSPLTPTRQTPSPCCSPLAAVRLDAHTTTWCRLLPEMEGRSAFAHLDHPSAL